MEKMIVEYFLDDKEMERLKTITEGYRNGGNEISCEGIFQAIMSSGSIFEIDRRFRHHESNLDLV